MADPFTAPVSYENLADFIRENPNRIYRYWIYRHGYTPYEQKQCYSDESLFEETRAIRMNRCSRKPVRGLAFCVR